MAETQSGHGPLPELADPVFAALPPSGHAKCLDWPAGCGEHTRQPWLPKSRQAVLRHREGCPAQSWRGHVYDRECPHPRCQSAEGWQCAGCGHYYGRSTIKDEGGEYWCRSGMGCQR